MHHDPIPIICPTHGGLMSPYKEVIGTDCPMCAFAERDLFRDLLERIEQHPQLSPCPDLRAEIREAIGA